MNRKELKRTGKQTFKKNYVLVLLLCVLLGMLKISYTSSFNSLRSGANTVYLFTHPDALQEKVEDAVVQAVEEDPTIVTEVGYSDGLVDVIDEAIMSSDNDFLKSKIFGHQRGVLASVVNGFTKGKFQVELTDAFATVFKSKDFGLLLAVLVSIVFRGFVHYAIIMVIMVVVRRIVLEIRIYEKATSKRFLFLYSVKRWMRVALVMLYKSILEFLWGLTIIGGIIKAFSYAMVPYIIAENPNVKPRQAIKMSRVMMKGHKFELFKLYFSFFWWYILSGLTFGLSAILYSNPYRECVIAEYYAYIRKLAIEKQLYGYEMLYDTYLFEKAPEELLRKTYPEAEEVFSNEWVESDYLKGFKGFLAKVFGVVLFIDGDVKAVEEIRIKKTRLLRKKDALDGKAYPMELYPVPWEERRHWVGGMDTARYYTIWSLLSMFIIFCFIGWCWEVSLHIVQDGTFVNRGMLHGPWIPIYGSGGVLILVALKMLRKHPIYEFVSAMILAGFLEYFTSLFVELSKGKRWWDYSGYFLNLNGRICGEGLLVFGIMGIVIVYVVAPFLDHYLRKIPKNVIVPVSLILMAIFLVDCAYSSKHPNEGKGITDYTPVDPNEEACIELPGEIIVDLNQLSA